MPHACRCIVQLTVLGYILVPIFTYDMWWLVLLYAFFMLLVGCVEAVSRPQYTYRARPHLAHAFASHLNPGPCMASNGEESWQQP